MIGASPDSNLQNKIKDSLVNSDLRLTFAYSTGSSDASHLCECICMKRDERF